MADTKKEKNESTENLKMATPETLQFRTYIVQKKRKKRKAQAQ